MPGWWRCCAKTWRCRAAALTCERRRWEHLEFKGELEVSVRCVTWGEWGMLVCVTQGNWSTTSVCSSYAVWRLCAENIPGINGGRGFFVWKVKQTHKCLKPALFLMATRGWYQRLQVLYKSMRKQPPAWTSINTSSVTYFGSYWWKRSAL